MPKEILMTSGVEIRAEDSEEAKPKIEGYAALFNKRTTIGTWYGSFTESIKRGAFESALSKKQDVRALFNHDANYVLGRTKSGTLILREDDTGLWTETDPPNTPIATSVVESIRRGDVDGMSFAFTVKRHEWEFSEDPAVMDHREILEVDVLYDVGPVTYPAYEATSVKVREALGQLHKDARSRFESRKGVIVQVPRTFAMFECRAENDEWQPDETGNPRGIPTEPTTAPNPQTEEKPPREPHFEPTEAPNPPPAPERPEIQQPTEAPNPQTEEEKKSAAERDPELLKREVEVFKSRLAKISH